MSLPLCLLLLLLAEGARHRPGGRGAGGQPARPGLQLRFPCLAPSPAAPARRGVSSSWTRPLAPPPSQTPPLPGEWQLPGAYKARPLSSHCHLVAVVAESTSGLPSAPTASRAAQRNAAHPEAAAALPERSSSRLSRAARIPAARLARSLSRPLLTSPRPRLSRAPGRRRGLPGESVAAEAEAEAAAASGSSVEDRPEFRGPCRGRSPSA